MPRLPDRFDLWVRKAKESADPARQVDLVLGALVSREELYFLNGGTKERPSVAQAEVPPDRCAIVFTDAGRVGDFRAVPANEPPVIVSATAAALAWCVENSAGLLINPGDDGALVVNAATVAAFFAEWQQRGGRQAAGFWIPNMTSEEEDFWQENGL